MADPTWRYFKKIIENAFRHKFQCNILKKTSLCSKTLKKLLLGLLLRGAN